MSYAHSVNLKMFGCLFAIFKDLLGIQIDNRATSRQSELPCFFSISLTHWFSKRFHHERLFSRENSSFFSKVKFSNFILGIFCVFFAKHSICGSSVKPLFRIGSSLIQNFISFFEFCYPKILSFKPVVILAFFKNLKFKLIDNSQFFESCPMFIRSSLRICSRSNINFVAFNNDSVNKSHIFDLLWIISSVNRKGVLKW